MTVEPYQRRVRLELSETGWAFFPVDVQGMLLDDPRMVGVQHMCNIDSGEASSECRAKAWTCIADYLSENTSADFSKAIVRLESGCFVSWADPRTPRCHGGFWLANIAEYQASSIAKQIGISNWIHANAYYADGVRVAADQTRARFFDVHFDRPGTSEFNPDKDFISFAGEPVHFGGHGSKLDEFLGKHNLDGTPGMLVVVRTSPKLVSTFTRLYPNVSGDDLPEVIAKHLAEHKGPKREIAKLVGIDGSEIAVMMLPPKSGGKEGR